MSLNITPISVVEVMDPRLLTRKPQYAILKGGAAGGISWKKYTTTSVSNSSIQFSTPPPNARVFVDRKLYFLLPVRITLTSSAPNAFPLLRAGYDAPRSFPIASSISTLAATINNTTVSMNMADVIQGLLRFNTGEYLKEHDYSMTPSAMDMSQEYNDVFGGVRDPLQQYASSNQESVTNRGAFSMYKIVTNTPSQAVIDCVFCENLYLSPFYFGNGQGTAFFGVQDMSFNFTFVSNPAFRMWSHNPSGANAPGAITGGSVQFNNFSGFSYADTVPALLFNYISPQNIQHIPPSLTYSYFNVARYFSDFSSIAPNAQGTLTSNTIVLQSIPRRIYIWARSNNEELNNDCTRTDTFLSVQKYNPLQLSWNNYNGTFAGATAWDLYKMSVSNHCNLSWTEWSGGPVYSNGSFSTQIGTVGSPICVELAKDVGIGADEAPGMIGQFALQVTLNVVNTNQTRSVTPTLVICVVSEGTFTILENRAVQSIGVVSAQDVLEAKQNLSDFVDYQDIQEVNGGNFFNGLKAFGSKIMDALKSAGKKAYELYGKAKPYIEKGMEYAEKYGPMIAGLAAGLGDEEYGGVLVGDQEEYSHGGRSIARSKIKRRLRRN